MTLCPRTALRRGKGQPEGSAVTGKTGKPWVAGTDRKTWNAAGQGKKDSWKVLL
jgi:hypothetical protein